MRHLGLDGQTRKRLAPRQQRIIKNQWHEAGPLLNQPQPELPRNVITKSSRANLGDRQPASGDDQGLCLNLSTRCCQAKATIIKPIDALDGDIASDLGSHIGAFAQQHVDHVLRIIIAEQLSQLLFMIGDAVLFNQCNEIMLAVLP